MRIAQVLLFTAAALLFAPAHAARNAALLKQLASVQAQHEAAQEELIELRSRLSTTDPTALAAATERARLEADKAAAYRDAQKLSAQAEEAKFFSAQAEANRTQDSLKIAEANVTAMNIALRKAEVEAATFEQRAELAAKETLRAEAEAALAQARAAEYDAIKAAAEAQSTAIQATAAAAEANATATNARAAQQAAEAKLAEHSAKEAEQKALAAASHEAAENARLDAAKVELARDQQRSEQAAAKVSLQDADVQRLVQAVADVTADSSAEVAKSAAQAAAHQAELLQHTMSTKAGLEAQAQREEQFRQSMNATLAQLLNSISVEAATTDHTAQQLADAHAVLLNTSMNAQLAAKQAGEMALSAALHQREALQSKLEIVQAGLTQQELAAVAAASNAAAASAQRAEAEAIAAAARAKADQASYEAKALETQLKIAQAQHAAAHASAQEAQDKLAVERIAAEAAAKDAAAAAVTASAQTAELSIAQHRATAAVANATALQASTAAAQLELKLLEARQAQDTGRVADIKARLQAAEAEVVAAAARTEAAQAELAATQAKAVERQEVHKDIVAQLQVATQNAVAATEARAAAQAKADEATATAEARTTELSIERTRQATEAAKATEAQRAEAAAAAARQEDIAGVATKASAAAEAEAAVVLKRERALLAEREASSLRMEQERRKTELDIEGARGETAVEVAKAKAQVEAEASIKAERENEDVKRRLQDAAAEAERTRLLAAVNEVFARLADGAVSLVTVYALHTIAGGLALFVSFFAARELMRVLAEEVKRQIGMPSLVRESSMRTGLAGMLAAMWGPVRDLIAPVLCPTRGDAFGSIVLPGKLEADLRTAARSIENAKRNHAPLRHIMFHGPPGTGKTMAAQLLARHCGLDYAIMSGGDVAPLGAQAVEELHKLFAWARGSSRGVLLFIDEAEAFLGSRGRGNVSEHLRNVLSALLYHTGTQSTQYMLVLATNRPQELDSAVLDRVDISMYFPVPDAAQRARLVYSYLHEHVLARCGPQDKQALLLAAGIDAAKSKNGTNKAGAQGEDSRPLAVGQFVLDAGRGCCMLRGGPQPISVKADVTMAVIDGIVAGTAGFSGRAISKVLLSVQGDVYATQECTLDAALLQGALARAGEGFALRADGEAWQGSGGGSSKRSVTPEPGAGVGMGGGAHKKRAGEPLPFF